MWPLVKQPAELPEQLRDFINKNGEKGNAPLKGTRGLTYSGLKDFSKYDVNSFAADDMTDARAMNQSNWDAWGNIIAKNLGKLALRTADGLAFTVAAPINLASSAAQGDINSVGTAFESIFDNPVSQKLREYEKSLESALPVYQTTEQQNKLSVTNLGFADKLMDGLAYIGSMYIGGRALGAIGAAVTGNRAIQGLNSLIKSVGGSKNLGALMAKGADETGDMIGYVGSLMEDATKLNTALREVKAAKSTTDPLSHTFYAVWGGMVESAAEASETKEQTYNNIIRQLEQQNNGTPLTDEQKEFARQQSAEAGTLNFLANIGTTTLMNKTVFSKLFNNKYADDMVSYNRIIKEGDQYAIKEAKTKLGKYWDLFKRNPYVEGFVGEAAQEGGQFFSNDFFTKVYSQPSSEATYNLLNIYDSLISSTGNMMSKDALESMLIGGIIGGPLGGYMNRGQDAAKVKKAQEYIDLANTNNLSEIMRTTAKSIDLSNASDGALINGDRVTYETLKAAQIFDYVYSRDQLGKFGDIQNELEEARSLPLATFMDNYGITDPNYSEEKRNQYIDYIGDVANKTQKSYSKLISNYGHKLAELEQENPQAGITKYLTMMDVLKEDYIKRESELIEKLKPYMDYQQIVDNALTPDRRKKLQDDITELDKQVKQAQSSIATAEDPLAAAQNLNRLTQELVAAQNTLTSSIIDFNYLDQIEANDKLEEKTKKRSTDTSTYQDFKKDAADLKKIQKAKESLINHYHKIVNNVDYARKVQKDINLANQSEVLKNVFALNLSTGNRTRRTGKINEDGTLATEEEIGFVEDQEGTIKDFVKIGDIYSLSMPYEKKDPKTKDYKPFEGYNAYEVLNTTVEMVGTTPVGKVTVQGPNGGPIELTMNQFKNVLRPLQYRNNEGDLVYNGLKYEMEPEDQRFYRLYGNSAIEYELPGGQVVTGMLGIDYRSRIVLKYFDSDGKFRVSPFYTKKADKHGGYIRILNEEETLAYKLKDGTSWYTKSLTTAIKNREFNKNRITSMLNELNAKLADEKNDSTIKAIQSLSRYLEGQIDKIETELQVKQAALDRLSTLDKMKLDKDPQYTDEINAAVDHITNYKAGLAQFEVENPDFKELRKDAIEKAMTVELNGTTESLKTAKDMVRGLKQSLVNEVKAQLQANPSDAEYRNRLRELNDPNLNPGLDFEYVTAVTIINELNLGDNFQDKIDDTTGAWNNLMDSIQKYRQEIVTQTKAQRDEVLRILGQDPKDLNTISKVEQFKNAEYEAVVKLTQLFNNPGFRNRSPYRTRVVEETEYDLDDKGISEVTSRPEFILKSTGNSTDTSNQHKKAFYDHIQSINVSEVKGEVIKPSEYQTYGLEGNGVANSSGTIVEDPIYIKVIDNSGNELEVGTSGTKLITTLPLPTLSDSFGERFRNAEGVENAPDISKVLTNVYLDAVKNNSLNTYPSQLEEAANNLKDSYTDAKEIEFINNAKEHLESLFNFRQAIKEKYNGEETVTVSVIDKSNGVVDKTNVLNEKGIEPDGELVVADSEIITVGSNTFRVKPGRAYYIHEDKRLLVPIVVDNLGDKRFAWGKDSEKSFVDNIIDGGKYVLAAWKGQATSYLYNKNGQKISVSDALTSVNNDLGLYTYMNNNQNSPNAIFTYDIVGNDVVFRVGNRSFSITDPNVESDLREALSHKIFNINRKVLLENKKRRLGVYQVQSSGEVHAYPTKEFDYKDFVMEHFGVKSNIKSFQNGYLVFNGNVEVSTPSSSKVTTTGGGLPRGFSQPSSLTGEPQSSSAPTPGPIGVAEMLAKMGGGISIPSAPSTTDTEPSGGLPRAGASNSPAAVPIPVSNTTRSSRASKTAPTNSGGGLPRLRGNKFRASTPGLFDKTTMSSEQLRRAQDKFRSKYGVEFEIVKGLVDNDAYGIVLESGNVLLSEEAIVGTDYHEEFHLVSQHILNRNELIPLYDNWREVNSQPELSNEQVEEKLAEEFRAYALNRDSQPKGFIRDIFDKLINAIKSLLRIGNNTQQLFKDIYEGKYYGKPVYKGTVAYKSKAETNFETLNPEVRNRANKSITSTFVNLLVDIRRRAAYGDVEYERGIISSIVSLATSPETKKELLNGVHEPTGKTYLEVVLNTSINIFLEEVKDTNSAQYASVLKSEADINAAKASALEFITGELGLKGAEVEVLEEDETDRSIIKVGDQEVDFFTQARDQLKFLAYTQASDADGNYPLEISKLTKLYMDNLVGKTNPTEFFNALKDIPKISSTKKFGEAYSIATDNINSILGLGRPDTSIAQIVMQNTFFSMFAKEEVKYKVLKAQQTGGPSSPIDYYFVDQSKEKGRDEVGKEFRSFVKLNMQRIRDEINPTWSETDKLKYVFKELFDRPYDSNALGKSTGSILKSFLNYSTIRGELTSSYLSNKKGDVNAMVDYIVNNNPTKIFSIRTAEGKPLHSLQNPTSLHRRLRDYKTTNQNTDLMLEEMVFISGINSTLKVFSKDGDFVTPDTTNYNASKLTEPDLLNLYFSALTEKDPFVPFIFNGDKGSLPAITLKGEAFNYEQGMWRDAHERLRSKIFIEEIDKAYRLLQAKKEPVRPAILSSKFEPQLPFYSFIKESNPKLYDKILKDIKEIDNTNSQADIEAIASTHGKAVEKEFIKYYSKVANELVNRIPESSLTIRNTKQGFANEFEILDYFVSAYALATYEQTKLVGDLNFYSQPAKRLNLWTAAKSPIRTDEDWLNWYNGIYNSNMTSELRALVLDDIEQVIDTIEDGKPKLDSEWDNSNAADAQAWITLDAARFMLLGSGKMNTVLEEMFYEIGELDSQEVLSTADALRINELTRDLGEYLNVLKPQFTGMQDIGELEVPTMYKFSVVPLSKALVQGKNLEKLYDLMTDKKNGGANPIHIVMTDSANKVGRKYAEGESTKLYENGKYSLTDNLNDLVDSIQVTKWEDIGIQVDMPNPHRKVTKGTQMSKKFTENLSYNPEARYNIGTGEGKETADEAIKYYEKLQIEKANTDEAILREKLGINEKFEVTPKALPTVKKELTKLANLSGASFATLQDIQDLGTYDFASSKDKLRQIVNSLVTKQIIKSKMFGDAKAMVSSVGFEKKNGEITRDNRLKFYRQKDGEQYMEVFMPLSREYEAHVYWDASEGLFKFKDGTDPRIMNAVGFRIPTQSAASIENIRIKGFLPAVYGNAVVVPFELPAKAGSDFDIDKLNIYLPVMDKQLSPTELENILAEMSADLFVGKGKLSRVNYYNTLKDSDKADLTAAEQYIVDQVYKKSPREPRYVESNIDNRLLSFYINVMNSEDYFPLFAKSIDTNKIKKVAKEIEKIRVDRGDIADKGDNNNYYNWMNPLFNVNRRDSFMGAKQTLGAAALATTHHAEMQKHKVSWKNKAISATNSRLGDLLNKFANINPNEEVRFDRVYMLKEDGTNSNELIADYSSEFINSFVDALKDDYITSANVDLETINVAMLLTRTGMPVDKVLYFLSQPGVVEYTRALKNSKVASIKSTPKYIVRQANLSGNWRNADLNTKNLKSYLRESPNTENQKNMVNLYRQLEEYAEILSNLVKVTTFDTKGTDRTVEQNESNLLRYNDYTKEFGHHWTNYDSLTSSATSSTANMRTKAEKAKQLVGDLFNISYLYDRSLGGESLIPALENAIISKYREKISEEAKRDYVNKLKSYYSTYLLQSQAAKYLGSEKSLLNRVNKAIGTLTYLKENNVTSNYFINNLRVIDNRIYAHNGAGLDVDELSLRQESFMELYRDPGTRQFAEDLALAALVIHGEVVNPFTYRSQIPTDILLDTIGVQDKDQPLLTIVRGLKVEERNKGVANSKAFVDKGYSEVISNYVLNSIELTTAIINSKEDYNC